MLLRVIKLLRRRGITIKLDMVKAYDHVEWMFN